MRITDGHAAVTVDKGCCRARRRKRVKAIGRLSEKVTAADRSRKTYLSFLVSESLSGREAVTDNITS